MNDHCLFCRLIKGEIPSTRVFEDEETLAFLDIGPIVKGHTLVVPKRHYGALTDAPPEVLAAVMRSVQRVARALFNGLGADGVNIFQANGAAAGQVIPHLHVHVIPRFTHDGHHWNWRAQRYEQPNEMEAIAERIRAGLPHAGL